MKTPKKFSWKVTVKPRPILGVICFQEQCSSGGGGNGKCGGGGKCGSAQRTALSN